MTIFELSAALVALASTLTALKILGAGEILADAKKRYLNDIYTDLHQLNTRVDDLENID